MMNRYFRPRFGRSKWLLLLVLLGIAPFVPVRHKGPKTVNFSGPFRAVDGDTLTFGAEHMRLRGLDAPERRQLCGEGRAVWPCGRRATEELAARLNGATCTARGRDKYRRRLASCSNASGDIGAALVLDGMAVSYGNYAREEAEARAARRGLWAGPFMRPEDWRKVHRPQPAVYPSKGWLGWLAE